MIDKELQAELDELSDEDKELTDTLLRLANIHTSSRKTFTYTLDDIHKRANEKNISFNEARRQMRDEIRPLQQGIVSYARKLLKPRLSKNVLQQLGVKSAGRPKGSKKREFKYSKHDLNTKLSEFIRSYYEQEGTEPTIKVAAEALGLGYAKKLRSMLKRYGDDRNWKAIVNDVLARRK